MLRLRLGGAKYGVAWGCKATACSPKLVKAVLEGSAPQVMASALCSWRIASRMVSQLLFLHTLAAAGGSVDVQYGHIVCSSCLALLSRGQHTCHTRPCGPQAAFHSLGTAGSLYCSGRMVGAFLSCQALPEQAAVRGGAAMLGQTKDSKDTAVWPDKMDGPCTACAYPWSRTAA